MQRVYNQQNSSGAFGNNPDEILGYELSVFCDSRLVGKLRLPAVPDGFFRVNSRMNLDFLSIVAQDNCWIAKCGKPAYFMDVSPEDYNTILLSDNQRLNVECGGTVYTLYTEKITPRRRGFSNYILHHEFCISIGSSAMCDISYANRLVRPQHAFLRRSAGVWSISVQNAEDEICVNNQAVRSAQLQIGDRINLWGMSILIGSNFISINDKDPCISVNPRIIRTTNKTHGMSNYSGQSQQCSNEELFNRTPRKVWNPKKKTITIEAPPPAIGNGQMPLILRMGSSMVMGGKAAMSGNISSLVTALVFPFLSSKYTETQKKEYESRRQTRYAEYLAMKRAEILAACHNEEQELNAHQPSIRTFLSKDDYRKRLWERRPADEDFLVLRLGQGQVSMHTALDYPEHQFQLETDELEEKMYQLVEKPYFLNDVPIPLSLTKDYVCSITGSHDAILDYFSTLIAQIALFHSPDEVKMVFLINSQELKRLDFVRYLPHCWSDEKTIRFLAVNETQAYKVGEYLQAVLPENLSDEKDLQKILKSRKYYVVFATDKKLFSSIEIFKTLLQSDNNHGFSFITGFHELPKECRKIIELNTAGVHKAIPLRDTGEQDVSFVPDSTSESSLGSSMRVIANMSARAVTQEQGLPKMITFLEMMGVGRIDQLNALQRWRDSNPVKSLSTPVGVASDGSLFSLDLHEKHHGPHGLIAGTTGSGKSEFIITYILSMALNYHPDEVAFILIDYKGGGLAGAFENPETGIRLPHLIGTVTNLDGASIQRSMMSIESELKRRQRILNEAKSAVNEGTLDIYGYQKLYRNRKVAEPMPHLFIISDEFAELKAQQPEFMEKLISAARIGRSLGVHLILATQKPAGVVNDQIRSNTKFRVCLRVQDRSDSMDMLKRPEAAELTDTGRFYLQVGYNEFFALGQSAWCGANYEPQDSVIVRKDDEILFVDNVGLVYSKTQPKVRKTSSGLKQIVAVVNYLHDVAQKERYVTKMLWQAPLAEKISLDEMRQAYPSPATMPIRTVLGMVDDPEHQSQYAYTQEIQNIRNLLIAGEGGSGKSTLLQSMVYALATDYSPSVINFHFLDFSGKVHSVFRALPHCGSYLADDDENYLERFFAFLSEEIRRRRKLFEQANVSCYEDYIQDNSLPLILVIIDNLSGMNASKIGSAILFKLHEYIREASGCGIRYVVAVNFMNECTAKSRQEFDARLALKSKDRYTFNDVLGAKVKYTPPDMPGRGMCLVNGEALEFHAAMIETEGTAAEKARHLRERISAIAAHWQGHKKANAMMIVNPEEPYADFVTQFHSGRIPLGYLTSNDKAVSLPLKQLGCLSLYFGNPAGVSPVLQNILSAFRREKSELIVLRRKRNSIFGHDWEQEPSVMLLDSTPEDTAKLFARMCQETPVRVAFRNEYCEKCGIDKTRADANTLAFDHIHSKTRSLLVLFESFADFCLNADESTKQAFFRFFQKGKGLNYYFIGCFYPNDAGSISANPIMKDFNPDKLIMLFGGQFDRAGLVSLPYEYSRLTSRAGQYNNCLMHYQGKFETLRMPCGKLQEDSTPEDDAPIF